MEKKAKSLYLTRGGGKKGVAGVPERERERVTYAGGGTFLLSYRTGRVELSFSSSEPCKKRGGAFQSRKVLPEKEGRGREFSFGDKTSFS